MYTIKFSHQAKKDIDKLSAKQKKKLKGVLTNFIAITPEGGKKLIGELTGNYSIRLTIKDRIVYSIDKKEKVVWIKRARTHYGE